MALNRTGTLAYVVNNNFVANVIGSISKIDTTTDSVVATVQVGYIPQALALSSDNGTVYVTNSTTNTVFVIDASTNTVVNQFNTGNFPYGIALVSTGTNNAPMVNPIPNGNINEGATYTANGSFTDPDSTSWTATVDYGDGSGVHPLSLSGMTFALSHQYAEEGTYTVTVSVTDNQGATGTGTATVTVSNAPFTVSAITAPLTPTAVHLVITVSATFADSGPLDTHSATWTWGDKSTSPGIITESNGSGSVQATHTYTAAGVYTVGLTVTDDDGVPVSAPSFQYIVVYDPSAGFVTGSGWYTSPAGAYPANPSLTGKLQFGFDVKYQAGASVPTGSTQLTFKAANLTFQSIAYQWLVLAGASAQFKGTGTINGSGNYTFLITLIDGRKTGPDLIRIKIWDTSSGTVIYDSQPGAPDTATPTMAIGGGNLIIH